MSLFDQLLASEQERTAARDLARFAIRDHGAEAEAHLAEKLADPRRRRSLRTLRLALAIVRQKASEHA